MKAILSFIALFGISYTVLGASQVTDITGKGLSLRASPSKKTEEEDSQTLAHFATTGTCTSYVRGNNREKELRPCKTWCEAKAGDEEEHGYGCKNLSPGVALKDLEIVYPDADGNLWTYGDCECDLEIVEAIVKIVIKGLAELDNIICAVMLESFNQIAQIGINFIPGGQAVTAVRYAVQGAKTFLENGMAASDFFGSWVGSACGVPNWDFDLMSVFTPLVNYPDAMATSIGCKKSKGPCKKLDAKLGDDPTVSAKKKADNDAAAAKKKKEAEEAKKKADEAAAAQKKKDEDAKTKADEDSATAKKKKEAEEAKKKADEDAAAAKKKKDEEDAKKSKSAEPASKSDDTKACKVRRTAIRNKDIPNQTLGADEASTDCKKTVHVTRTARNIGSYISSNLPITCSKKWGQACYHYRSVMSVHAATPDMTAWTCQETPITMKGASGKPGGTKGTKQNGIDGDATARWGQSAMVAKPAAKEQHWFPWANGFVPRTVSINIDGKLVTQGCDRDEFPPRYFWRGDSNAQGLVQRIRFINWKQNEDAGKLWAQFCNKNGATTTNALAKTAINSGWIRTVNVRSDAPRVGPDKTTTVTSFVSINTGRAVFSINNWDGLPSDPQWHGMKENECWNSAINPEDPGFAVMTDDEFYRAGQHPELAQYTSRYRELPPLALVQPFAGNPPYNTFSSVDAAKYEKIFAKNHLPDGYLGVLPGIPTKPRKVPRRGLVRRQDLVDGWNSTVSPTTADNKYNGTLLDNGSLGANSTDLLDFAADTLQDLMNDLGLDKIDPENLEQYDSDLLELYLQGFVEVKEPTRTEPMQTNAQPTAYGQGNETPTPAHVGSIASAGMPRATGAFV